MSSPILGLANTGAKLPAYALSSVGPIAVSIIQYPMRAIYPSNFTTGDSVGYPI